MSHKFNPEKAQRLISPARYQELKPDILLQRLGIRPGSTILDLGCGNGFFTFPAAAGMGPEGMVIAADTSAEMLSLLNRRMPMDTVQVLNCEEVSLDVEDATVDATVAIALYHEFKSARENLIEIHRVLKPGGRLMLLDWDPEHATERGPQVDHRVPLATVLSDLEATNFLVDSTESYVEDMWLILAHTQD